MTKRHTPPSRNSNERVVIENPSGPHHSARCSGIVHALKTSARGASKVRVPLMTLGSLLRSIVNLAGTGALLKLRDGLAHHYSPFLARGFFLPFLDSLEASFVCSRLR